LSATAGVPRPVQGVHIATFCTDVSLLPQHVIEIKVAPRIEPLHVAHAVTYLMDFDNQNRECHPSTWLRTCFDRREKSLKPMS
jgi:hypothetical protein